MMLLKKIHKKIIENIPSSSQTIVTDFDISKKDIAEFINNYFFDFFVYKNICDCCFNGIDYWVILIELKDKNYWTLLPPEMSEEQVKSYIKPITQVFGSKLH